MNRPKKDKPSTATAVLDKMYGDQAATRRATQYGKKSIADLKALSSQAAQLLNVGPFFGKVGLDHIEIIKRAPEERQREIAELSRRVTSDIATFRTRYDALREREHAYEQSVLQGAQRTDLVGPGLELAMEYNNWLGEYTEVVQNSIASLSDLIQQIIEQYRDHS